VCLAIPAKVIEIDGTRARVEMAGNVREADLTLLPDVNVGEYVLLHAGFAIGRYDEETALATLRDLEEIARLARSDSDGDGVQP
jgi:hydrogenase expression/formation protein HypC